MSCKFTGLAVIFCVGILLPTIASAQEETTEAKQPAAATKEAADFGALIKQLDAEEFGARQEASKRLADAGEQAIPALEKAAASESREASMRAFDILAEHFSKGASPVKDAAKQALERLAKSEGSAGRRAAEVLTPPMPATPPAVGRVPPPIAGGFRVAGARIMVAGAAGGGGVETKIRIENGVKTTEVKDKERKVKIVDDPDKGLQLEVTETKDGKEVTKKYDAKNAEDLKTKDAEAHKIYEQYSQKGAEIKIGGFGLVPGGPIAPGVFPAPRLVPIAPAIPVVPALPAPDKKSLDGFEALEKSIQEAEASLQEALKQSGDSEQLKRTQERLEDVRKQLEKLRSAKK